MTVIDFMYDIVTHIQDNTDELKIFILEPREKHICIIDELDLWTYNFSYTGHPDIEKRRDKMHRFDECEIKSWSIIHSRNSFEVNVQLLKRFTKPRKK